MDRLREALEASDQSAVLAIARDMHYADLAALYEDLDDESRDLLFKTLGPVTRLDCRRQRDVHLLHHRNHHPRNLIQPYRRGGVSA